MRNRRMFSLHVTQHAQRPGATFRLYRTLYGGENSTQSALLAEGEIDSALVVENVGQAAVVLLTRALAGVQAELENNDAWRPKEY